MIYIHIPFCRSFCTYCDFYSEAVPKCSSREAALGQSSLYAAFEDALVSEIRMRKGELVGSVNTLYIGGGTPSVLPLSFYERLVSVLHDCGVGTDFEEFTIEVNPEDVVEKGTSYFERLKSLGVNRISMGVQSFDDSILKWMNRRHDARMAREAYSVLESSGIENISIDLIFGMPQLSELLWERTIDSALCISDLGRLPSHISAYQLSLEPGSALAKLASLGRFEEAGEVLCSRQYEILCSKLSEAGYHHYEISNFALPGKEAVHNAAYWNHVPYAGFGPGAHSFMFDGEGKAVRKWNKQDLKSYIETASVGFPGISDMEVLTDEQFHIEEVMLSLRTDRGIERGKLFSAFNKEIVLSLLRGGSLQETEDGRIRIAENHFFVSDSILAEIV